MSFANPSGFAISLRIAARLLFGRCVFDRGSRELTREGVRQDLTPKAFQLLEALLEARPRALTKQEIYERLWPDAFVSESSVPRLAAEVRAAIGDDAKAPALLRTVHRYGYAFIGAVSAPPEGETPAAAIASPSTNCRLVWGDRQIPLHLGENVLGRAAEATIWIDHARVSRHHARIDVDGQRALLQDLKSSNGTFVRGRRIVDPVDLSDGDEIVIGPVLLVFRTSASNSTTEKGTAA
jgi:DNA-binding winged helix-turn-helix (wHTH) protein